MKVAIPISNHRISPLFDTARRVLVVVFEKEKVKERTVYEVDETSFFHRIELMKNKRVEVLICGAISRPLEMELQAQGIQVISHICGEVEEVLEAYNQGEAIEDHFVMPGCCRKRRFRYRHHSVNCYKKGISH